MILPILVACSLSLVLMSTDIFFPSLASMAQDFSVSAHAMKSAIWMNLLGSFLSSLVVGSLSDRYGRKVVMQVGLCIFMIFSIGCCLASSFTLFITCRLFQGIGASVPFVVGIVAIQDAYDVKRASKLLGLIGATMQVVPTMAPVLGGHIELLYGWQMSFVVIACLSILLFFFVSSFFPETLPPKEQEPVAITSELSSYLDIIRHRQYLFIAILYPLLTCAIWAYLTVSPFYFVQSLQISPEIFGLILSSMTIAYASSSLLATWLIEKRGLQKTLVFGLTINLLASIAFFFAAFFCPSNIFIVVSTVFFYCAGISFVYAPSTSLALRVFPFAMGKASALRNTLFCLGSTIGSFSGGFLSNSSLVPLSGFFFAMIAVSIYLYTRVEKPEEDIYGITEVPQQIDEMQEQMQEAVQEVLDNVITEDVSDFYQK